MSAQLDQLVQQAEALQDPQARDTALQLAQGILDLHATALERLMELVSEAEGGAALMETFAADPQVGGVLLLHGLHPQDLETRVRRALDDPAFRMRGAGVELISVEGDLVRVRIEGGGALHSAVEQALWDAAPDAREVILEGAARESFASSFVPLGTLLASCP
jgi:hypothetical protein